MPAPPSARFAVASTLVAGTIFVSVLPSGARTSDSLFRWLVYSPAPLIQNVMHVVVYAILAWSIAWSLEDSMKWRRRAVTTFLACFVLGIALEGLQAIIPGRLGTLIDVGLNTAGVLLGLQVFRTTRRASN